jgi:hypothetical protein
MRSRAIAASGVPIERVHKRPAIGVPELLGDDVAGQLEVAS